MKSKITHYISVIGIVIGLFVMTSPVFAADIDQSKLGCASQSINDGPEVVAVLCDLGIQKQVAINGGSFNDADTTATAVKASIGSTVTYKITLDSFGTTPPYGVYYIKDVLPPQLQYVAHQAVFGSYEIATNLWTLDDNTTFPTTLTLTASVVSGGLVDNVAGLEFFADCSTECTTNEYSDDNPQNNSDHAYINVANTPQVLGTSTTSPQVLAETGSSIVPQSIIAVFIIAITLILALKKSPNTTTGR